MDCFIYSYYKHCISFSLHLTMVSSFETKRNSELSETKTCDKYFPTTKEFFNFKYLPKATVYTA